jgi:hypothetical protein
MASMHGWQTVTIAARKIGRVLTAVPCSGADSAAH